MLIAGTQEITSSILLSSSYELSTRKLVMTGCSSSWHRHSFCIGEVFWPLLFFFILFFSFIPDNYHQYKICMFVCMYTYIHVYVCIYKDINNANTARELHSLQRNLFQKSLPVKPSHDKNQGSYYRRYYKIFTLRFVLCFLCCRYMVFTKSCIAILTNASVQMAGRGILLACFIGSSQGIYSLF